MEDKIYPFCFKHYKYLKLIKIKYSPGSKEFVDKYRFVHSIPNIATRVHYCSRQLVKALDEMSDYGSDSSKNCKIWENVIFDNSPDSVSFYSILVYYKRSNSYT